jgi:hypothetical protein
MALTEMIQTGTPLAIAQPTTPPSTPNLPSSEQVVTLSNAQQLIEMVKVIVAIEIASTASASKLPCSHTPPESPNLQSSTRPLTVKDLEQLFLKFIEKKSPDSTELPETAQPNSLDQVLEKVDATNKREDAKPEATKHVEAEKPKLRASKLEYKLVDEVYITYSVATIFLTSPVQLG